jgi:hypothetical protein
MRVDSNQNVTDVLISRQRNIEREGHGRTQDTDKGEESHVKAQ